MRVFIIVMVLAVTAMAEPRRSMRIVGGNATTIQEYPFMSNMQYSRTGAWWYQSCGGSLITARAILSAAHCYYLDSPSSWRVVLGSTSPSQGGATYKVAQLILHAEYNTVTYVNDVAIVKLQSNALMSSRVYPARIAGSNYSLKDGAVAYAVGWGTLSSGGSTPSQLQHVDVNIVNQQICAERYAALKKMPGYEDWPDITNGMICTGLLDIGGKDSCQGDSGGPLVYKKDVVIGITSWGFGCGHSRYPGVNTRVSSQTNWILANA